MLVITKRVRAVIVGALGYGGAELVKILARHPEVEIVAATSSRQAGQPLRESCPWLSSDLILQEFNPEIEADVFFFAQENGFTSKVASSMEGKTKMIDLAPDFRLKDAVAYENTYQKPWPNGSLKSTPVYGVPELGLRDEIRATNMLANPGCYAITSILSLAPLARGGFIGGIPVLDGKSGVSGAGRSRTETAYTYSELDDDVKAYAAVGHRHTPEIQEQIGTTIRFTPHLIPVARGMEVSSYVPLKGIETKADLFGVYQDFYLNEPFVNVFPNPPSMKQVRGSNRCDIGIDFDYNCGYAVISAVTDNLGKGAAGNAVQCMNLMFDLPETMGLPVDGLWP